MTHEIDDFFTPDADELNVLQKRYGEMNPKGIAWIREYFDTFNSRQAVSLLNAVDEEIGDLAKEAQQLHDAARDIIDDDRFLQLPYNLEEFGDIGFQADNLRMMIGELEDKLEAARILLAPLERLTVLEDDDKPEEGMLVAFDEAFTPRLFEASSLFEE